MEIIKRNGYGSNFNILYYDINNSIIIKKTINQYGINKLKNEIFFYNFIKKNNINFNIPIIYKYDNDTIIMNYIKQNKLKDFDYFNIIINNLNNLHNYNNIIVDKNYYKKILLEETIIKMNERFIIKDIINKYHDNILYVNNIKLLNFDSIIKKINNYLDIYIDNLNDNYILQPIHGDPQYNNIIFNNYDIIFIDPKGCFGSSQIYGIKEYDIAKLFFSLSGYEKFDNMIFDDLIIDNNNLNIDFINIPKFNLYNSNSEIIKYLFVSIWLSNAHIFIKEPYKVIYSFYIGLYFASVLL
jgi:tRNA A-37 threonylcarbamoyl transferase component Bud32